MNSAFPGSLTQARNILHVSQSALAKKIGISRQTVSKWETGQSYPELTKIPLICTALKTTPDYLFSGIPPAITNNNTIIYSLPPATDIGQKIKDLRTGLGMSQECLADRIRVTRQTVSRWETGMAYPEMDKIILLLDLFKLNWSELIPFSEEVCSDESVDGGTASAVFPVEASDEANDREPLPVGTVVETTAETTVGTTVGTTVQTSLPHDVSENGTADTEEFDAISEKGYEGESEESSENDTKDDADEKNPEEISESIQGKPQGSSRSKTVAVFSVMIAVIILLSVAVILSLPHPNEGGGDVDDAIFPTVYEHIVLEDSDEKSCQLTVPNSESSVSLSLLFPNITQDKYYFSTDAEGKNEILGDNLTVEVGNSVFYIINKAQSKLCYTVNLRRRPICTVTFEGTDEALRVEEGSPLTIPSTLSVTKENYDFVGWDFDLSVPITSDAHINAKWEPKMFTVNLYYNDGKTPVQSLTLPFGSKELPTPTRDGDVFEGWYAEPTLETRVTSVGKNGQTLYAKYESDKLIEEIVYKDYKAGLYKDTEGVALKSYTAIGKTVKLPKYIENKPLVSVAYVPSKTYQLYIPSTVLEIEAYSAQNCTSLKKLIFEEGSALELINCNAFYKCGNLEDVVFPETLRGIYNYAFAYCDSLKEITLPGSIGGNFGAFAFYHCNGLTTLTVEEGISDLDTGLFAECISLKNVSLPSTLTEIEELVFNDCISLETLEISKNVTYIDESAFLGCNELTVIYEGTEDEWRQIYSGNIPVICLGS